MSAMIQAIVIIITFFMFGAAAEYLSGADSREKLAYIQTLIEECEQSLPRDKFCVIIATPEKN